LFPFTDIFCFFCNDLGGFEQVAEHVAGWLENGCQSTLPVNTHPRIVIATEKLPGGTKRVQWAKTAFFQALKEKTAKSLLDHASAIDIVELVPGRSRFCRLKTHLLAFSDQARKERESSQALFSLTHFAAFLNSACAHFCKHQEPFNFIESSREENPVSLDLERHLSRFLEYIKTPDQLIGFAAPVIASSLVLDSYPPDAHRKCYFVR
jgi:hypothetical protein